MRCHKCNEELDPEGRLCASCGASVDEVPALFRGMAGVPIAKPPETQTSRRPMLQPKPSPPRTGLWQTLVVLLALVATALAVTLVLTRKDETERSALGSRLTQLQAELTRTRTDLDKAQAELARLRTADKQAWDAAARLETSGSPQAALAAWQDVARRFPQSPLAAQAETRAQTLAVTLATRAAAWQVQWQATVTAAQAMPDALARLDRLDAFLQQAPAPTAELQAQVAAERQPLDAQVHDRKASRDALKALSIELQQASAQFVKPARELVDLPQDERQSPAVQLRLRNTGDKPLDGLHVRVKFSTDAGAPFGQGVGFVERLAPGATQRVEVVSERALAGKPPKTLKLVAEVELDAGPKLRTSLPRLVVERLR